MLHLFIQAHQHRLESTVMVKWQGREWSYWSAGSHCSWILNQQALCENTISDGRASLYTWLGPIPQLACSFSLDPSFHWALCWSQHSLYWLHPHDIWFAHSTLPQCQYCALTPKSDRRIWNSLLLQPSRDCPNIQLMNLVQNCKGGEVKIPA